MSVTRWSPENVKQPGKSGVEVRDYQHVTTVVDTQTAQAEMFARSSCHRQPCHPCYVEPDFGFRLPSSTYAVQAPSTGQPQRGARWQAGNRVPESASDRTSEVVSVHRLSEFFRGNIQFQDVYIISETKMNARSSGSSALVGARPRDDELNLFGDGSAIPTPSASIRPSTCASPAWITWGQESGGSSVKADHLCLVLEATSALVSAQPKASTTKLRSGMHSLAKYCSISVNSHPSFRVMDNLVGLFTNVTKDVDYLLTSDAKSPPVHYWRQGSKSAPDCGARTRFGPFHVLGQLQSQSISVPVPHTCIHVPRLLRQNFTGEINNQPELAKQPTLNVVRVTRFDELNHYNRERHTREARELERMVRDRGASDAIRASQSTNAGGGSIKQCGDSLKSLDEREHKRWLASMMDDKSKGETEVEITESLDGFSIGSSVEFMTWETLKLTDDTGKIGTVTIASKNKIENGTTKTDWRCRFQTSPGFQRVQPTT
ncbi:hypothetical protein B0H66DRAFT_537486 [Apodospora peruviana]|uniref:Uncharacterized protein n=1 Tax=Apodospora peruviana TaxID=516989 RepID=A0AAE0HWK8_9PEZI|nr:hypothetical protein B0H66DRAFT_537486 [Apodospora peruviana]